MDRNFNEWLSKFKTSISDYTYYVDFEKIYKNVDKVKVELNILNSLIGSKNIEEEFQNILIKYPETLECIPLLLAVRSREIFVKDEINEYVKYIQDKNPGKILSSLELKIDGEYVDMNYEFEVVPFERIRRITGYLVGTVDRFNNGKRAEERDRVKHNVGINNYSCC